jgi:hypothetical protein
LIGIQSAFDIAQGVIEKKWNFFKFFCKHFGNSSIYRNIW